MVRHRFCSIWDNLLFLHNCFCTFSLENGVHNYVSGAREAHSAAGDEAQADSDVEG